MGDGDCGVPSGACDNLETAHSRLLISVLVNLKRPVPRGPFRALLLGPHKMGLILSYPILSDTYSKIPLYNKNT